MSPIRSEYAVTYRSGRTHASLSRRLLGLTSRSFRRSAFASPRERASPARGATVSQVKIPSLPRPVRLKVSGRDAQRPFFERLGTPAADKRRVIFENSGHVPPRGDVISEVLPWLDKYLGR